MTALGQTSVSPRGAGVASQPAPAPQPAATSDATYIVYDGRALPDDHDSTDDAVVLEAFVYKRVDDPKAIKEAKQTWDNFCLWRYEMKDKATRELINPVFVHYEAC